jgi:membrane peptidoglycan carboxypeptidase
MRIRRDICMSDQPTIPTPSDDDSFHSQTTLPMDAHPTAPQDDAAAPTITMPNLPTSAYHTASVNPASLQPTMPQVPLEGYANTAEQAVGSQATMPQTPPPLNTLSNQAPYAAATDAASAPGDRPAPITKRPPLEQDVPFHLPMAADAAAKADDDETGDLPAVDDAAPGGFKSNENNMPTMPVYAQPSGRDNNTLMGTGGLDPNPDLRTAAPQTIKAPRVVAGGVGVPAPIPHQQVTQAMQAPQAGYNPYQAPPPVVPPNMPNALPPMPQQGGYQQPPSMYTPQDAAPAASAPKGKAKKGPRRKIMGMNAGCVYAVLGLLLSVCGGSTLLTAIIGGWAFNRVSALAAERVTAINDYTAFQSTYLYDRNGVQLYEIFNEGRRETVAYEQFPQVLIDATIATEDDSFFNNSGIDLQSTIRATLQYIGVGEGSTGGSTITQQLVRGVLFDYQYRLERSVTRKAEEIVLSLALTQQKTKQEILAMYLNEIYYGNLAYGAQAAARVFFNKDVSALTLGEAALLAGLPQSPANLDPLNPDPIVQDRVLTRWRYTLDRMLKLGFITQAEHDQALADGLQFNPSEIPLRSPHFVVFARTELEQLMSAIGYSPEQIANGGWQVYTTVDTRIDDATRQLAAEQVTRLNGNNVTNGAVVVIQPMTGQILAMAGSIDYFNDAIDGRVNVTTAPRQPGSTMKIFTYSAAIEGGWLTPASVLWDTPTRMRPEYPEGTPPRNYDGSFRGPVTIRFALANSLNIPALQAMRYVGVEYYVPFLKRLGMGSLSDDLSQYGISMTLGGGEVTLLELTRGYGVYANQGNYVPTTSILCVLDNSNTILYEYQNSCPRGNRNDRTIARTVDTPGVTTPVLDPRIAFMMSEFLADNNSRSAVMGSNSPLNTGTLITSVKTGTTNDFKDNWTVGYTPNVVVGVWVGNNDGDPMNGVSGLAGAAPIWNSVITMIHNNPDYLNQFAVGGALNPEAWDPPAGMTYTRVCDVRRLTDNSTNCPASTNEWLLDSPAGLPDGAGGLAYPPSSGSPLISTIDQGVTLTEESYSVIRVVVQPLDPAFSAAIQFNVPPGQTAPPPPLYCRVPDDLQASAAAAQSLLFLAPPINPRLSAESNSEDAAGAENWARARGIAFLPSITCTPDMLTAGGGFIGGGGVGLVGVISSPANGQTINGQTTVFGTASFTSDQVRFYKLEIRGGAWADWTTIGDVSSAAVVNGQLGIIPPLPVGTYELRLVLASALNSDFALTPYVIQFTVSG